MQEASGLTAAAYDCLVRVDGRTLGSGFLVAPGYVVTCAHVADVAGSAVTVHWRGAEFRGKVAAASAPPDYDGLWPYPDLAIVTLADPPTGHPCAWLEDQIPPGGELLTAFGYSDKYGAKPAALSGTYTCQGGQDLDGGWMLRLKQDEVTPGMSGGPVLRRDGGGICGVVKATRMDDTDMGGLATPIGALRRLDPEVYRALIRAHDRFHALKQGSCWPDVPVSDGGWVGRTRLRPRAQRTLFGLLEAMPVPFAERLPTAFQAVAGKFVRQPALPMLEHRDVISELEALPSSGHGVPSALRYAASVVHEVTGPVAETLGVWIETHGDALGLHRADLADLLMRPNTSGAVLRSVMIRIRPATVERNRYHVAMWRYEGPQEISPVAGESAALPLDAALAEAQKLLPQQLALLSRTSEERVMVELIVPQGLMEEEFDRWRPWARGWSVLGLKHPVVVRDLERFDDDEPCPYWRGRWSRLASEGGEGRLPMELACNHEVDPVKLEGWIESDPSLGVVVLADSLRNGSSGTVLEVALGSGIPVVLWRRADRPDCAASGRSGCPARGRAHSAGGGVGEPCPATDLYDRLRKDMAATPPTQLPERVRLLRSEAAAGHPNAQHAHELVLLWDDPERRLPVVPLHYA